MAWPTIRSLPIEFIKSSGDDVVRCENEVSQGAAGSDAWSVTAAHKTLTPISDIVSTSGDTTLVAAPGAGYRIVVTSFVIQNVSSTATTMILQDGSDETRPCLGQNQGDGLTQTFAPGSEWRLTENSALVFNLSGANQCRYTVDYYIEAV